MAMWRARLDCQAWLASSATPYANWLTTPGFPGTGWSIARAAWRWRRILPASRSNVPDCGMRVSGLRAAVSICVNTATLLARLRGRHPVRMTHDQNQQEQCRDPRPGRCDEKAGIPPAIDHDTAKAADKLARSEEHTSELQ